MVMSSEGKQVLFQDSSGADMDEEERQAEVGAKETRVLHSLKVMAQNCFLQKYSSSCLM